MSCCGKIKAVYDIVNGNTLIVFNSLFQLPRPKYEYADIRLAICRQCEMSTWLTISEYAEFLKKNGIEVVKNIDDLSRLPMLEKKEHQHKTKLFCRICKCWLPAKSYVKNQQCPLNKWSNQNG